MNKFFIWVFCVISFNFYGQTTSAFFSVDEIPAPLNYNRPPLNQESFAYFLRHFRLKPNDSTVTLFNGELKTNQKAHYAILDIEVGNKNLQQCADAVIRMRSEYLYQHQLYDRISFNFTSGHQAAYIHYANGFRPKISNSSVVWVHQSASDYGYANFRKYLEMVFTYAGTYSLSKELDLVPKVEYLKIGDVFIQGGFPGHAVIVMDVAINPKGHNVFLLAQSFMPAQEIHILKNLQNPGISPWYHPPTEVLKTPEWVFYPQDLKSF